MSLPYFNSQPLLASSPFTQAKTIQLGNRKEKKDKVNEESIKITILEIVLQKIPHLKCPQENYIFNSLSKQHSTQIIQPQLS